MRVPHVRTNAWRTGWVDGKLAWFSVDLFLDPPRNIVAVTLDLCEP